MFMRVRVGRVCKNVKLTTVVLTNNFSAVLRGFEVQTEVWYGTVFDDFLRCLTLIWQPHT